jgi:hypothetical protein
MIEISQNPLRPLFRMEDKYLVMLMKIQKLFEHQFLTQSEQMGLKKEKILALIKSPRMFTLISFKTQRICIQRRNYLMLCLSQMKMRVRN